MNILGGVGHLKRDFSLNALAVDCGQKVKAAGINGRAVFEVDFDSQAIGIVGELLGERRPEFSDVCADDRMGEIDDERAWERFAVHRGTLKDCVGLS